ncbi:patatin-like phospholipase family protein, partial [Halomonas sp. BM-2019]|uniref:patatin-like phospholipase family protein n=1 Tax=Halomonas sp. BM-2019 TaxID=2811227 RepID=UPI001B3C4140
MATSRPSDGYLASSGTAPADSRHLPDEILLAEREEIARRRNTYGLAAPDPQHPPASGLALSGGGIRSATFCLGVAQALAEADQLKRFDYLSTVSGGGYLGASLLWWASGSAGEPGKGTTFGLAPWQHPEAGL